MCEEERSKHVASDKHLCDAPRDKGGVADERLRVWRTRDLRVVDAGVMPIIPRANTLLRRGRRTSSRQIMDWWESKTDELRTNE